jgi:hypothetical protein
MLRKNGGIKRKRKVLLLLLLLSSDTVTVDTKFKKYPKDGKESRKSNIRREYC